MKQFELKHILLATDFSNASTNALNTAVSLAQQHGSMLTLLHVIDHGQIHFANDGRVVFGPVEKLVGFAVENLNILAKTVARNFDISARAAVLTGKAPHEICSYASKEDVDLIVVGKRGDFSGTGVRVGDIAMQVFKRAPLPVLCVPAGRLFTNFHKILFPVQELNKVMAEYKLVLSIGKNSKANVVVAGLARKNTLNLTPGKLIRVVQMVQKRLEHDGLTSSKKMMVSDNLSQEVIAISEEEAPDLIFLSQSKSRNKVGVPNSFPMEVLERSSCPVLSLNNELSFA